VRPIRIAGCASIPEPLGDVAPAFGTTPGAVRD
jgi:hypothetical protein